MGVVRDHLTILAAFHALRTRAGDEDDPKLCETAAVKYARWAQRSPPHQVGDEENELELPSLGVLMCWHAHMLNPRLFDRECEGAYRSLRGRSLPLHQVVCASFALQGYMFTLTGRSIEIRYPTYRHSWTERCRRSGD